MVATTYRKFAELLRDTYYASHPSDDAQKSLRYFAELAAIEVAFCASMDAFANSNAGESTYANNQFISTFKEVPILVDTDGTFYSVLPSTPAGLPNGREINSVSIEGSDCMEFVPVKAQQSFAQGLIGNTCGINTYEINGTNIKYKPFSPLFEAEGNTSKITMVGAVGGESLLNSSLTIPKNYESVMWDRIWAKLAPTKVIPYDTINDSISNP